MGTFTARFTVILLCTLNLVALGVGYGDPLGGWQLHPSLPARTHEENEMTPQLLNLFPLGPEGLNSDAQSRVYHPETDAHNPETDAHNPEHWSLSSHSHNADPSHSGGHLRDENHNHRQYDPPEDRYSRIRMRHLGDRRARQHRENRYRPQRSGGHLRDENHNHRQYDPPEDRYSRIRMRHLELDRRARQNRENRYRPQHSGSDQNEIVKTFGYEGDKHAKEIRTGPRDTITEPNVIELPDTECIICRQEYVFECQIAQLRCAHFFHQGCILEWIQTNPAFKCVFKCTPSR